MAQPLLWLLLAGPLALVAVALAPPPAGRSAGTRKADRAFLAGCLAVASAVAAAVWLALAGPLATGTIGLSGVGFALTLDQLSAIAFLLVAFVGTVVIRYSRNYLDGDPGQSRFVAWLAVTLASVLVLILSGNLFQFVLAFVATSLALHRLLLFYPERPSAVLAARKKFIASRIADACLVAAAVLAFLLFGSLDHAAVTSGADALREAGETPPAAVAVAVLLVIAAVLKSAQFPLHGWLLEVMETPTPVSALLHAGIINAGGYLILRHAHLVTLSPGAMEVLVVVGGLTALFGSVVMLTQTSVKASLAYSTVAQMGFMMLQCGLGAFSAALLHLVAHSLYKAHAFLSSGSVIDLARASWTPSPGGRPHPYRLLLAIGLVLSAALLSASLFGATLADQPGVFALTAIVVLGLAHLVVNAVDERPTAYVIGRTIALAAGVAALYVALQYGMAAIVAGALPPVQPLRGVFDLAIIMAVLAGFTLITVLQSVLPARAGEPRWQALHAHVASGFYVNTVANRLVIRFWPAPSPRPALASAFEKGH